ncbi:MAG: hypothetical protein ACRCXZ_09620 [Patescibacteria group bacterium]
MLGTTTTRIVTSKYVHSSALSKNRYHKLMLLYFPMMIMVHGVGGVLVPQTASSLVDNAIGGQYQKTPVKATQDFYKFGFTFMNLLITLNQLIFFTRFHIDFLKFKAKKISKFNKKFCVNDSIQVQDLVNHILQAIKQYKENGKANSLDEVYFWFRQVPEVRTLIEELAYLSVTVDPNDFELINHTFKAETINKFRKSVDSSLFHWEFEARDLAGLVVSSASTALFVGL